MTDLIRDKVERFRAWAVQAETWQVALVGVLGVLLLAGMLPVVVTLAVLALLYLFAVAWLREFEFLIQLRDDAFPGRNDKLIWALLLIVLPPVGVWLFHSYRGVRWPEPSASKRGGVADPLD